MFNEWVNDQGVAQGRPNKLSLWYLHNARFGKISNVLMGGICLDLGHSFNASLWAFFYYPALKSSNPSSTRYKHMSFIVFIDPVLIIISNLENALFRIVAFYLSLPFSLYELKSQHRYDPDMRCTDTWFYLPSHIT